MFEMKVRHSFETCQRRTERQSSQHYMPDEAQSSCIAARMQCLALDWWYNSTVNRINGKPRKQTVLELTAKKFCENVAAWER